MKVDNVFSENVSRKLKFLSRLKRIKGTLPEDARSRARVCMYI